MPNVAPVACFVAAFLVPFVATAQESRAVLHAPLAVLPVDSPPFQRLGDFDGDGDLDAVGSRIHQNRGNTQLVVWENQGGAFTVRWSGMFPRGNIRHPAPRSFAMEVGDFDGDGRTDFVATGGDGVVRFLSQPGWQFLAQIDVLPQGANQHAVAVGDLDGDAFDDVAITYLTTYTTGNVTLLRSSGGPLSAPITASYQAPLRVHALELDGAPGDEVLLSDRNAQTAHVYAVVGNQLVLQQSLTTTLSYLGNTAWKWMGGDLDLDGDVDVIVFKPELGSNGVPHYQIFRRTGPSTFTREPELVGGPAEYLADIDGDGDLDGVCCGGSGPIYVWPKLDFASTFLISQNRGGGDFARAWAFPGAGSESMARAADIDGDGDVEFVAGRCVYYGRGPWLEHPMPIAGGEQVMVIGRPWLLHDEDRDGDLDFFGRNRGDGSMDDHYQVVAPPAGLTLNGAIAVDVDGDGARDRLTRVYAGSPPNQTFQHMAVLRNNGGGHYTFGGQVGPNGLLFGSIYAYTVDNWLAADCDGDGDEDVLANGNPASSGQSYNCQIFWNQNGAFAPGPAFTQFAGGRVDAVADFDGDSLPDLLMSTLQATSVWRGTGNPATPFQSAWAGPAMPFEPAGLVVADLNDDGREDFARLGGQGEIVLFVNVSFPAAPLQFAAAALAGPQTTVHGTSLASAWRSTLTAGDFDDDGRTDLALGHALEGPNIGLVLRRTGWSNPPTIANYDVVRQTFVDGFACDIDGDGDTDLVGDRAVHNPRFFGHAGGQRLQKHVGTVGEAGAAPVLGGSGPYRPGHMEAMHLTGVPGPSVAVLGLSLREVTLPNMPLPGLTMHVDPTLLYVALWPIAENGRGRAAARTDLPTWIGSVLSGHTFFAQAFVVDSAAPGSFTQSNLLEKRIGW